MENYSGALQIKSLNGLNYVLYLLGTWRSHSQTCRAVGVGGAVIQDEEREKRLVAVWVSAFEGARTDDLISVNPVLYLVYTARFRNQDFVRPNIDPR